MKNTKVTVVTVCLNAKDVIEKTIRSVISQSYENIEYIIIDGASCDGTLDIVKKYEGSIHGFCTEKDKGIYDAMNKGIRMATGDLIGFLNAGDYYEDGAIEAAVSVYQNSNADIIYGDAVLLYDGEKKHRSHEGISFDEYFIRNPIVHQSIFTKTTIQKKEEFDTTLRILSDYAFFLNQYMKGAQFRYVKKVIAYYDMGGVSAKEPVQAAFETRNILMRAIEGNDELVRNHRKRINDDFLFKMFMIHCEDLPQYGYYLTNELKRISSKYKNIIIFGTGEIATRLIKKIKIDFDFFVDNNGGRQGQILYGKRILSPTVLKEYRNKKVLVLVFSTKYEKEIKRNIIDMSSENNIDYMSIYQLGVDLERKLYAI